METTKTTASAKIAPTRITATELARNLSDILNRVRYRGETFIVERKGEVIAELGPEPPRKSYTVGDFRRDFAKMRVPEGLADAIEDGLKALKTEVNDPWQSS